MTLARACCIVFALALVACGHDELVASGPPADAGPDTQAEASTPPDPGPRVRSVELRNPFGNTKLTNNLLVDGDFELTSSSGQFGWRAIGSAGEGVLLRETGGLCRSGVTCGIITPGTDLLAMAAAPRDQSIEVSIWTKPPVPDCSMTAISLIGCTGVVPTTLGTVPPETLEPDASGWCRHRGVTPATGLRPCLIVSSFGDEGQRTLIDDGSMGPAPVDEPSSVAAGPPSEALYVRAERALRVLRDSTRFGRVSPTRP